MEFYRRMKNLDEKVAEHLDSAHRTRCAMLLGWPRRFTLNETKVWFKRPAGLSTAGLSTALQGEWEGPCEVPRRVGVGSYLISIQKGEQQAVHEGQVNRM